MIQRFTTAPPDDPSDDPTAPSGRRWDAAGLAGFVVVPLGILAAVCVWALMNADRLPDPIATHFGADGTADGFGGPVGPVVVTAAVAVPMIPLMGLTGSWLRHPRIQRRTLGPGSPTFTGFLCGLLLDILVPQLDASSADGVMLGSTWSILGTVIGFAIGALTAWRLDGPVHRAAPHAPDPSLPRRPTGSDAEYTVRTAPSTGMKVLVGVWFAVALASAFLSPALCLVLLLSSVYLLEVFSVRIGVTDEGVRFRGVIGDAIPLETITGARPARYDWGDSGGIGIRGVKYSGARGKRVAAAAWSGEALDVDTTGTNWTFVVPDGTAEDLAGDINARLDRLHGEADDVR